MRTLKLTHEQISLIKQAIGIAELRFIDIHKEIIQTTILVRGIESKSEHEKQANYYHQKACQFADLNIMLENGELDV